MTLLPIIYYGRPGLETQVFQSYMVSSGYRVQVVYNRDSASCALDASPDAIVVIAVDQDPQEMIRQAEILRAHAQLDGHVFLISPAESLDLQLSGIDVIPRPYRLSELVRRIRALTPDSKQD
jgi:DNA-binding response OmpR family regulator